MVSKKSTLVKLAQAKRTTTKKETATKDTTKKKTTRKKKTEPTNKSTIIITTSKQEFRKTHPGVKIL